MSELWPGSEDRPRNDGDRMLAVVRAATVEEKAEIVDALDDRQLAMVIWDWIPNWMERRFWDRLVASKPWCETCRSKHWPDDPHTKPQEQP